MEYPRKMPESDRKFIDSQDDDDLKEGRIKFWMEQNFGQFLDRVFEHCKKRKDGSRIRQLMKLVANKYKDRTNELRFYFTGEDDEQDHLPFFQFNSLIAGLASSAYHHLTGDFRPIQDEQLGGLGAIINESPEGLEFNNYQLMFARISGDALKSSRNTGNSLWYSENSGNSLAHSVNIKNSLKFSRNSGKSLNGSRNHEMSLEQSVNLDLSLEESSNEEQALNGSRNFGNALRKSRNIQFTLYHSENYDESLEESVNSENTLKESVNKGISLRNSINTGFALLKSRNLDDSLLGSNNSECALLLSENAEGSHEYPVNVIHLKKTFGNYLSVPGDIKTELDKFSTLDLNQWRIESLLGDLCPGDYSQLDHHATGGTRYVYKSVWGSEKLEKRAVKIDRTDAEKSNAIRALNRNLNSQNESSISQHITDKRATRVIAYYDESVTNKYGLKGTVIVEEFLDGYKTLQDLVEEKGPLPYKLVSDIFFQAIGAIRGINNGEKNFVRVPGKGVFHRDLKPSNIMVKFTDDGVDVKIGDWGLSKIIDRDRTDSEAHPEEYILSRGGTDFSEPLLFSQFFKGKPRAYSQQSEIFYLASSIAFALNPIYQTKKDEYARENPKPFFHYEPDNPDAMVGIVNDTGKTLFDQNGAFNFKEYEKNLKRLLHDLHN